MGTLLGTSGQIGYNMIHTWQVKREQELSISSSQSSNSRLKNLLDSSWSPVKLLNKEDYQKILNDKLLSVDAEIAIVEEEIASMKQKLSQETSAPMKASRVK
jgi:hypothetical protein